MLVCSRWELVFDVLPELAGPELVYNLFGALILLLRSPIARLFG